MPVSLARPDVVRAINQRWLLKFWSRHRPEQGVPRCQAVEAEDLSRLADGLTYLEVVGSGDATRFKITTHGATIGKVYGTPDCRGRFIDDIFPGVKHRQAREAYQLALETGHPAYVVLNLTDKDGRVVNLERLLLPFSTDGQKIDRILQSFEFICEDGAFHRDGLMMVQQTPPLLRLCTAIEVAVPA